MAGDADGGLRLELRQAVGLDRVRRQLRLQRGLHRRLHPGNMLAEGGRGEDDVAVGRDDLAGDRQGVEAGGEEIALALRAQRQLMQDGGRRTAATDAMPTAIPTQ